MKIFSKVNLTDYSVYWKTDADLNDMVDDMEEISMILWENDGFKKGNRIVCIRKWMENGTSGTVMDLYVTNDKIERIEQIWRAGKFKAVCFTNEIR